MGQLLVIVILTAVLFFAPAFLIRHLARKPFRWTFNPANTYGIVVTEKNDVDNSVRGGNIVDVLHAMPGKTLVRHTSNPMNWYFKNGDDPDHRNFLYQRLGVQDMGSVFYKLRLNVDKRERLARDEEKPETGLQTILKKMETEHVFFTGEMEIPVEGADTSDRVSLNFKLNFIFERKFPVRSVLRLADAPAFLASQVINIVNNETSTHPVTYYYGGDKTDEHRKALADAIDKNGDFKKLVEKELGLVITTVAIHDVDVEPAYKETLAKKLKAEKEAEASKIKVEQDAANTVKLAEADKTAQMLRNDADEDRINRVVRPAAENERTVAVRVAEAYENNKTVTTYAPGKDTMIPLGK